MKKIKIGFSTPKNVSFPIYSWAIRWYEKTPFSHVYIKWDTHYGLPICYHAASLMVHFMGAKCFDKKINVVEEFEFNISDKSFDKLMRFCITYAGVDYALSEVALIPLIDLGLVKQSPDDPWKQYCAELVMRALASMDEEVSDVGAVLTASMDRVKLKDVYNFVKNKHASGDTL